MNFSDVQLAKTWRMEKVIGILKAVGILVSHIVVALYRISACFHKGESKCCKLKLRRTITGWRTFLICMAGFTAVVLVLL